MTDTARLFVAVDLPDGVRAMLAAWARRYVGHRDDLRIVPAEALHLTLAFLGDLPVACIDELGTALSECAEGPVPLGVGAPLWLAPRRPHVLTVAVQDPAGALAALHRAVEAALTDTVGYVPDARAFRPHVTVARVRRGARVRPWEMPAPDAARFRAVAVGLYRSRRGAGGAHDAVLARVALPRPG
ncbi:MAG: RNA 2',3'-cyclic phosphodiesterase [Baekduiaceae bacterium]